MEIWSSSSIISKIQVFSIVWCLLLMTFGAVFISGSFSLGVLAGGIIASLNFYWFQRSLQGLFNPNLYFGSKAVYYFKYYIRLVLIGLAMYLLLAHQLVHPLGLIAGLSVIVVNIMTLAFSELWKIIRTKEAI